MKSTVSLILSLFLGTLCYGQHISEFTSLTGLGQDSNFNLPATHSFQVLFSTQDFLDIGGFIPANDLKGPNFDFAGYVPIEGSSKYGYLSINSEMAPGAVTILDIEFDDVVGSWNAITAGLVNFPLLSFPTAANCSGTVTPWNTIITCEEYTSIELLQRNTEEGYEWVVSTDFNVDGYHDLGWAIEIDPATRTIINQPGGRDDKDKLWAMGNFKHENAVIRADHKTVYQGADATNGDGYLFKFVASKAQDLSQGNLYVYKGDKLNNHAWLQLANSTQDEQNSTIAQCKTLNATAFGGIEDVEINPKDSLVYFAVKRETNTDLGIVSKGVVYRFKDNGNVLEDFEVYAGGNSVYEVYDEENNVSDNVAWGDGTDNLVFDDQGNLWVAQDGDDNYIWVVENGHTQLAPKVKIFARTPAGSEPTGLTFSPDFRYIFMSIQHPVDNNSSQTDVFGTPVSFNEDVVLVLARNEYLNKDFTEANHDIMISQYYHDEATNSKWIEIKNISDKEIAEGTYFMHLYDNPMEDITSEIPKASQAIPAMEIDQVLLFKNSENPSQPDSNSLGDAIQIQSAVCDFDGKDVVLITTTPGSNKYKNRKDIMGYTPASTWGQNTTLIRGGNSFELPERDFDKNNWIELDSLEEVGLADKNKNIALGTQKIDSTIWDGALWSNLEPDRSRNVSLSGTYDASQGSIEAYDLTIETGVSVDFNHEGTNNSVIVHNNLDIKGSLTIGDTESLIIKNTGANVTGEIEKIERSAIRNHPDDITYWSSPVEDEQIGNVFKDVDKSRIFYYDQTKHLEDDPDSDTYFDVWITATGIMEVAKGYIAEGVKGSDEIHQVSFRGKPNFGKIETRTLDYHDDGFDRNDFNLIGNPYTAAIDIEAFLKTNSETNTVIDGVIYLWTHATAPIDGKFSASDYITYNFIGSVSGVENIKVKKNIGSGQGFFVRSLKSDKLIFDTPMILKGSNDQFFKQTKEKEGVEKNRFWLNLKGSDNSFKQILIGFDEKASDEMDIGYDALYLRGNQPIAFYSVLDDRKLSIQGFGPFNDQKVVKLGFDAELEGLEMSIELSRIEGLLRGQEILVLDNEKGTVHDLKLSPYIFRYEGKGSFEDRFSIVFNSAILSNEDVPDSETVKIYMQNENLFVDSPKEIIAIEIYDILGRKLIANRPESKSFEMSLDELEKGSLFIVKIKGINGFELTRKMIKY